MVVQFMFLGPCLKVHILYIQGHCCMYPWYIELSHCTGSRSPTVSAAETLVLRLSQHIGSHLKHAKGRACEYGPLWHVCISVRLNQVRKHQQYQSSITAAILISYLSPWKGTALWGDISAVIEGFISPKLFKCFFISFSTRGNFWGETLKSGFDLCSAKKMVQIKDIEYWHKIWFKKPNCCNSNVSASCACRGAGVHVCMYALAF